MLLYHPLVVTGTSGCTTVLPLVVTGASVLSLVVTGASVLPLVVTGASVLALVVWVLLYFHLL